MICTGLALCEFSEVSWRSPENGRFLCGSFGGGDSLNGEDKENGISSKWSDS